MARITEEKRDTMWVAFQEKPTNRYVSESCGVSQRTAARYRELDKWDERIKEIRRKACEKADETAVEIRARHLKIIKGAIAQFVSDLAEGKIELSASDYEKLTKLELLLSGQATERSEEIRKLGGGLEAYTDEELRAIIEEAEDDSGGNGRAGKT